MQIEEQKNILEKELRHIEAELHHLGRELDDEGNWVVRVQLPKEERIDPLDDANLTEEVKDEIAVLEVFIKRYEQVKKALTAIDHGKYGICELCGTPISEERLKANPSATTCINCAE